MYHYFIILLSIILGYYFGSKKVLYKGPNPNDTIKKIFTENNQKYRLEIIKIECPYRYSLIV